MYAAPNQTVIAGPPDQVDAAVAVVDARAGWPARVEVDVASHHPTVDRSLPSCAPSSPTWRRGPRRSRCSPTVAEALRPAFDADYWVDNLRKPGPVQPRGHRAARNHATFVEVSPHPLLTHAINGTLESARPRGDVQVGGTLNQDNPKRWRSHPAGHRSAAVGA